MSSAYRPARQKLTVVRPTIASATRESLNQRPASVASDRARPGPSRPTGSTQNTNSSEKHPFAKKEKKDWTKEKVKNKEDWTKEKVIQTRSKTKQQLNGNLEFYQNKLNSKPGGHKIEEMLKWEKNYNILERNHRYIQWLFPLPGSHGMNPESQPLQEHEAKTISATRLLRQRVLRAYEMMLDFYGMELASADSGEVKRSHNWKERFRHLNGSSHNFMRISRILKSLGCLGYEHFQYPWLQFILEEAIVKKTLPNLDCGSAFHWMDAVANESEQERIKQYYKEIKRSDHTAVGKKKHRGNHADGEQSDHAAAKNKRHRDTPTDGEDMDVENNS